MAKPQTVILRQGSLFEIDSPLYGKVRGERSIMDYPFFALSKTTSFAPLKYEHENIRIEIQPGATGIATMYDKRILSYVVSLMAQDLKRGHEPGQDFSFTANDFFRATHTPKPSGDDYRRFTEALGRLQGTQLKTNIRTGNQQDKGWFSWLAEASANYETMPNGDERLQAIKVRLCAWLYRAVLRNGEIYEYHADYWRLAPMEQRLYEIAKCHCEGDEVEMPIAMLHAKVGGTGEIADLKRLLKRVSPTGKIPEYDFAMRSVIPDTPRLDTKGRRVAKLETVVVMTPRREKLAIGQLVDA